MNFMTPLSILGDLIYDMTTALRPWYLYSGLPPPPPSPLVFLRAVLLCVPLQVPLRILCYTTPPLTVLFIIKPPDPQCFDYLFDYRPPSFSSLFRSRLSFVSTIGISIICSFFKPYCHINNIWAMRCFLYSRKFWSRLSPPNKLRQSFLDSTSGSPGYMHRHHFPMQNSRNTASRTCSTSIKPDTLPIACAAYRNSSAPRTTSSAAGTLS
jgi:hypothetical protein